MMLKARWKKGQGDAGREICSRLEDSTEMQGCRRGSEDDDATELKKKRKIKNKE